jgi:hypothetical protein
MTAELDKIFEATQAEHARPVAAARRDRISRVRGPPWRAWLGAGSVEARYDKTKSTLDRWLRDPALNFPRPRYVRGKRIWHVDELDEFDRGLLEQS